MRWIHRGLAWNQLTVSLPRTKVNGSARVRNIIQFSSRNAQHTIFFYFYIQCLPNCILILFTSNSVSEPNQP